MKRKNEKVPEFDEIIFENRNKEYGAYDLRRSYNSVTSLSILGGIAFCALLITVFSFTIEKGTASDGPKSVVIVMSDPLITKVAVPETKPPAELTEAIRNLQPVVTDDSLDAISMIPITEELVTSTTNGDVNDTMVYVDPADLVILPEPEPAIVVDEMPEYPGGIPALMQFINEKISYPADAVINNIQGKVILRFVVKSDGSIDRITVLRSIDPALDSEAVRVVETLPKFKPGKHNGVAVPVWFSLPVLFRLETN